MEQELVSDFRKLNPEGKMIALASVKGFSHMAKFRNEQSHENRQRTHMVLPEPRCFRSHSLTDL